MKTIAVRMGIVCAVLAATRVCSAAPATQPATSPAEPNAAASELYQRICTDYLQSKWDDLEKDLKSPVKELASLSAAQQADVKYVRSALEECRPAWWAQCKAGQKVLIRPTIWGATITCTYDPAGKSSLQYQSGPAGQTMTISWPTADMDNPAHAEHGFSKGDLCNLNVWITLGEGAVYAAVPIQTVAAANDKDKNRLTRYMDFRGYLTGLYYGTPMARRWGLWLALRDAAKADAPESRKAVASMFLAEVLGNPAKYPTLKPPGALEADGAESKLADHFRPVVEKQSPTVAEDKALREAIKAFAAANGNPVLQSNKVTLENKLTHALDAQEDAPLRAKREAWLKAQFDKAAK